MLSLAALGVNRTPRDKGGHLPEEQVKTSINSREDHEALLWVPASVSLSLLGTPPELPLFVLIMCGVTSRLPSNSDPAHQFYFEPYPSFSQTVF